MKALIPGMDAQTFYPLAKAQAMAAELQAEDEDWKYEVVECANGMGRIDIYDEDGELITKGASF